MCTLSCVQQHTKETAAASICQFNVAHIVYARCIIRSAFSHEHASQNNCIWGIQLSIVIGYGLANCKVEKPIEADGLFIVCLNMEVCLLDVVILLGFKQALV